MATRKKRKIVKRAFNLKLKKSTVFSIAQIVFFALAALVIISFSRKGLALIKLNDLLVANFSWATIFFPFVFLSFAFMLSKIKIPLSQPNVVVGSLLFFISVATLGRAGNVGRMAWEGIASMVTGFGAFIIFLGTTIVGLIVLFNTSFEQVIAFISSLFNQVKKYSVGDKRFEKIIAKGEMKVSGGGGLSTAKP